jgi:hypothetical protein
MKEYYVVFDKFIYNGLKFMKLLTQVLQLRYI